MWSCEWWRTVLCNEEHTVYASFESDSNSTQMHDQWKRLMIFLYVDYKAVIKY